MRTSAVERTLRDVLDDWMQPVHHRNNGPGDMLVHQSPAASQLPVGVVRQPHGAGARPARPLSTPQTVHGTADRRRRHVWNGQHRELAAGRLETP